MDAIFYTILFPIAAGIILFIFPEKIKIIKGIITVIASCVILLFSYRLFQTSNQVLPIMLYPRYQVFSMELGKVLSFNIDNLSKTIVLFIGFFSLMFSLYSLSYITREKKVLHYDSFFLITIGASAGAALADHFLLFISFWGVLGLTLYRLMKPYDELSSAAAKKSLVIIGATDTVMIFGIGMLWILNNTMIMSETRINTSGTIEVVAFIAFLMGSLAKAGAFPLHSWLPDYTEKAPASSSALLPACFDKLVGIYFLARICITLFILNKWLILTLLIIGVITIIAAVLMALIQHSYKKLLGYHAVSQVGYMVMGLGLGTPIGIAGGLFHMINNALYKSGLFLTAGSVEKRTGKEDLEELGGLSGAMPLTFIAALICALSISGVPPFNGFASKWIIYQGVIDFGRGTGPANKVWVVWLLLAVFGSALTLASFIKFISGIYLGRKKEELREVREVSILMWLPQIIIALICVFFGIFATRLIVPRLFIPISGEFEYRGIWSSGTVTALVVVSIVIGFLIYILGNIKKFRTTDIFMGGETVRAETDFPAIEYYKTISNLKLFSFFYRNAEKRVFDIYDNTRKMVQGVHTFFSKCHSGILPLYVLWVIFGLIILVILLVL
ncbi:MAG: NADH-quinone oxidoreductase subunit 5 family protein [Spirochaetota bacterium]